MLRDAALNARLLSMGRPARGSGQPAGKPQAAPTYYGDPEPEPPPKEEPPKPDPDQQKKDEAAMSSLYTQIIREQRDLKSNLVGAPADEKARLQATVGKDIDSKRDRLKQQQEMYKKMYGKDYDPSKE